MSEKLKVMHVLKSSVYSGAENVVITIIEHLSDEFDFLYVATEGTVREKLEEKKVPFCLLEQFDYRNLTRAVRKYKPDIVHAHDFSATVLCALIPGKFALISHLHYDPPWARKWNLKTVIYTILTSKVRKILVVSQRALQNMVFNSIIQKKCSCIGNPININEIRDTTRNITQKKYDLIFVGRMVEQKNPQGFIKIVKMLLKKGIRVKCVMLGEGELLCECKELVNKTGLDCHIELVGFQKNPYEYIKKSRILCMTSHWEGYGLVILEANALDVPVLSSRTAGAEELLGVEAVEICDSDEEFVKKIGILLSDNNVYEEWVEKSQKRIDAVLNADSYMSKIRYIYRTAIL